MSGWRPHLHDRLARARHAARKRRRTFRVWSRRARRSNKRFAHGIDTDLAETSSLARLAPNRDYVQGWYPALRWVAGARRGRLG
jgi:hypothetical protein